MSADSLLKLRKLWENLTMQQIKASDIGCEPWMSQSPEVKKAWAELVQPSNIHALKEWADGIEEMNPNARHATKMALVQCERLAKEMNLGKNE